MTEPVVIRAIAWFLDRIVAGSLWGLGHGIWSVGGFIEIGGDRIRDAGYRVNDAAIWLLERWERPE